MNLMKSMYSDPVFFNHIESKKFDVALIGVPVSFSEITLGVEWFCDFLRTATGYYADWMKIQKNGIYSELLTSPGPLVLGKGCRPKDLGDIKVRGRTAGECVNQIESLWNSISKTGAKPLFIGGDHSATYLILKAYGTNHSLKDVVLLHFDAHNDYLNQNSVSLSHAAPIFNIVQELGCKRVISLGVRTLVDSRTIQEGQTSKNLSDFLKYVQLISPLAVREIVRAYVKCPNSKIPRKKKKKAYLTIDLDVLDPSSICGAVSVPIHGGLTWEELFISILSFRAEFDIIGCDVVEGNFLGVKDDGVIKNLMFLIILLVDVLSREECEFLHEV